MKELIDANFWGDFENFIRPFDRKTMTLKTDFKEDDKQFEFEIEIPGFNKEEIDIKYKEGYVHLSAQKNEQNNETNNNRYIKRERSCFARRSYFVGDQVREEDITAKYDNGVLTIIVPKQEPKKIPEHKIKID